MCPQRPSSGEGGKKGSGTVEKGLPEGSVELSRSLMRALRHTGISLIYQDMALRVVWAQNVPAAWTDRDLSGLTDTDFLPDAEAARLLAAKHKVQSLGQPQSLEISVPNGSAVHWYEISVDADTSTNGKVNGLITTAIDVTDRKRRE